MSKENDGNGKAKTATVVQVRESLVLIQIDDRAAVKKNEVGYVCVGSERLKAEVLRIRGRTADMAARCTTCWASMPIASYSPPKAARSKLSWKTRP